MERIEVGSAQTEAQRKPRWRTPELTQDAVSVATGGDTNPTNSDGQVTTYLTPLHFFS
jgi:hypothetical protein